MKKVKIAYWATIVVMLLLFFVQNQAFFMQKGTFVYNLIHIKSLAALEWEAFLPYEAKDLNLGLLFFFGAFFSGVALTFLYNFLNQIKYSSKVRFLSKTCESHLEKIKTLESELNALRSSFPDSEPSIIDVSKEEGVSGQKTLKKK